MAMKQNPDYQLAYDMAVRYLAMRMHTVGELTEKLKKKRVASDVLIQVLRRLEELDFLNDRRFAEIYVENLKRYKSFGYYGIKNKLISKKIPTDIVGDTLEEFFTLEEEVAVAGKLVEKLARQDRTSYQQLARSLASKGFRTEVISEVLRRRSGIPAK